MLNILKLRKPSFVSLHLQLIALEQQTKLLEQTFSVPIHQISTLLLEVFTLFQQLFLTLLEMGHQVPQSLILLPQSHVLLPVKMLLLTHLLTLSSQTQNFILRLLAHRKVVNKSLVLLLRNLDQLGTIVKRRRRKSLLKGLNVHSRR